MGVVMSERTPHRGSRTSITSEVIRRTKPRILVVDDSEFCLESVRISLEEAGYEVITLSSPFGFAAAIMETQPELVLVDVTMPGLSGDKLVEIATKNDVRANSVIILHSDRGERELRQLTEKCGASGFIRKTSDQSTLVGEVKRFLALAS
jgi:DNA-binding NtrC family response regulator